MMLFELLIGHALGDFALQSDPMAKGKNRHTKPDYIPKGQKFVQTWFYWLTAHALINGGIVYAITLDYRLGLFETAFHWLCDYLKCENVTNPHEDQAWHFTSKLFYCFLIGRI
jgi:hypothetical protein